MAIHFDLELFGKPGWMLPEGESITADQLRELAEDLHEHLYCTADVLEALTDKGWTNQMCLFSIALLPNVKLRSLAHAEDYLSTMGIDPEDLGIHEDDCDDADDGYDDGDDNGNDDEVDVLDEVGLGTAAS